MKLPFIHPDGETLTTIILARHGAAYATKDKDGTIRRYGKSPGHPLTDRGIRSAKQLSHLLEDQKLFPVAWYYSPRERTLQTAQILQSVLGTSSIIPDPRIDEIDYPGLTGQPVTEHLPTKEERDPGYHWELPEEVGRRISDFMLMLMQGYEGQTVGVVSHEAVISVMALWQLGIDLTGADTVDQLRAKVRGNPAARRIPKKFLKDGLDPGEAYITKVTPDGFISEGRIISPHRFNFLHLEGRTPRFFDLGRRK